MTGEATVLIAEEKVGLRTDEEALTWDSETSRDFLYVGSLEVLSWEEGESFGSVRESEPEQETSDALSRIDSATNEKSDTWLLSARRVLQSLVTGLGIDNGPGITAATGSDAVCLKMSRVDPREPRLPLLKPAHIRSRDINT